MSVTAAGGFVASGVRAGIRREAPDVAVVRSLSPAVGGAMWTTNRVQAAPVDVSRRHLEIRVTPDGVVATDLGSTNGTFVEGHPITAATLVDGNTVTLGRTRILFWTGADDAGDAG